jgi:acetyl-CoA carboxylase carboxyl transferase subunit beta
LGSKIGGGGFMAWFKKEKYAIVRSEKKNEIPEGTFVKCEDCGEVLTRKQIDTSHKVCPKCGWHMQMSALERVQLLIDEGTWQEEEPSVRTGDPLGFADYPAKLAKAQQATGLPEAVVWGHGRLSGIPVVLSVTDFSFMAGSMGSVVGEEITRAVEYGLEHRMPVILVSGSGGGARMHEGILSLMQMAKTSAALAKLSDAGVPFLSLLTHPTGGGVTASWAILGDLNLAEPNALIMFAGARVIEQTIRQRLPKGFQRSEFLQEHGVIDQVVERGKLKEALAMALSYLKPRPVGSLA